MVLNIAAARAMADRNPSRDEMLAIRGLLEEALRIHRDILGRLNGHPADFALRDQLFEYQELAHQLAREHGTAVERYLNELLELALRNSHKVHAVRSSLPRSTARRFAQ